MSETLTKSQERLKQGYAMFKKEVSQQEISKSEQEFDDHIKALQDWSTKANETHHSTNTGYGAEFMPAKVQGDINMSLIYQSTSLAAALGRGYMGENMPHTYEELIIGASDDFIINSEYTAAAGTMPDLPSGQQKPQTAALSVVQRQFKKEVQVSKLLAHYWPANFISKVSEVLRIGAAKTIDKFILNADSDTSTNINYSGATPTATNYYLNDNNGIRDVAIANSNTFDVGTLTADDLLGVINLLGDYGSELDDLLWVCPMNVYLKLLALDQTLTVDKFWPNATFTRGVLAKAFGIDVLVTNAMPSLALATGKVHYSTGNSYGQFALVYRPSVIHGSGDSFDVTPTVMPGKGVRLTATFDYGMGVAYNLAGLGATVALGRNVTV